MLAAALGYDFVPALVPRTKSVQRDNFFEAYRALFPQVTEAAVQDSIAYRKTPKTKKAHLSSRKREYA